MEGKPLRYVAFEKCPTLFGLHDTIKWQKTGAISESDNINRRGLMAMAGCVYEYY